ncbi:hypothetical protein EDD18DRAFT_1362598 [Armillaria luteobubalina]|uniref:Uncharacterized protein n=1 Tax=Armillaria luteobubalina TaxID=153913 RepID=A0AA39UD03_9AGAR|nr:hypothetical protein EDD18DRAFT_1362598 [Armillaria luteobubalina]
MAHVSWDVGSTSEMLGSTVTTEFGYPSLQNYPSYWYFTFYSLNSVGTTGRTTGRLEALLTALPRSSDVLVASYMRMGSEEYLELTGRFLGGQDLFASIHIEYINAGFLSILPFYPYLHEPVFDLLHELLPYILHFADTDTPRALCLTERCTLYRLARDFLWRNVTLRFGPNQKSIPDIFSFDPGHLGAIRTLSIIVDAHVDLGATSFPSVSDSMINIDRIRVSGGSGTFVGLVHENIAGSLVMLELYRCHAELQDFSGMAAITIRDLRILRYHSNVHFLLGPVTVVDLEVRGLGVSCFFM